MKRNKANFLIFLEAIAKCTSQKYILHVHCCIDNELVVLLFQMEGFQDH